MGEAPVDLAAGCYGDALIGDIAGDPRAGFDHQFAYGDRTLDIAGKTRRLRHQAALDAAFGTLHQRGAGNIPLDMPIDMQIRDRADITLDRHIRAEDREGGLTRHGLPRGLRGGRYAAWRFAGFGEHLV